jgi:D-alanyl-D-alanine carboxypeptidase
MEFRADYVSFLVSGGIFVRKIRVSFIFILAIVMILVSSTGYAATDNGGFESTGGIAGAWNIPGGAAGVRDIPGGWNQGSVADAQAGLQEAPADNRQIILVKIVGSSGDATVMVSLDDLVMDVAGCTYEPADKDAPLIISKNVSIVADNIILTDAVIEGDLYISADNAVLRNLDVQGTIYIDPFLNRILKLDNVTSGNVAIWAGSRQDAGTADNGAEGNDIDTDVGGKGNPGRSDDDGRDDTGRSEDGDRDDRDITGNTGNTGSTGSTGRRDDGSRGNTGMDETGSRGNANRNETSGRDDVGRTGHNGRGNSSKTEGAGNTGNSGNGGIKAYMQVADIDDYNSILVVVNKTRSLPADWKPEDLVILRVDYRGRTVARYMRREASEALTELFADAAKEGIVLCAVSGYRSYSLQEIVFSKHMEQLGLDAAQRVSALPGQSEHQTGLAIDISSKTMNYDLDKSFANTPEGKWLAENAAKYGFILRYPEGKEAVTGYDYEPWHFRYVGRDIAADVTNKGLTLEEYFGIVEADPETGAETTPGI